MATVQTNHGPAVITPPIVSPPIQRRAAPRIVPPLPPAPPAQTKRKMVTVSATAIIIGVALLLGLVKLTPSGYKIRTQVSEYEHESQGERGYLLTVDLSGKARKLLVVVMNNDGRTTENVVERESLLDGRQTVRFHFKGLKRGVYKVVLKDYNKKNVLAEQDFTVKENLKPLPQGLKMPEAPL